MLSSHLLAALPRTFSPSGFPSKILYAFLITCMRATCLIEAIKLTICQLQWLCTVLYHLNLGIVGSNVTWRRDMYLFLPFRYRSCDRPLPLPNKYVLTSKIRIYALTPGKREVLPGTGLRYHINK